MFGSVCVCGGPHIKQEHETPAHTPHSLFFINLSPPTPKNNHMKTNTRILYFLSTNTPIYKPEGTAEQFDVERLGGVWYAKTTSFINQVKRFNGLVCYNYVHTNAHICICTYICMCVSVLIYSPPIQFVIIPHIPKCIINPQTKPQNRRGGWVRASRCWSGTTQSARSRSWMGGGECD